MYICSSRSKYHPSRPPKPLKVSSFQTPYSMGLMGLPGIEYTEEAWPKNLLKGELFHPFRTKTFNQYSIPSPRKTFNLNLGLQVHIRKGDSGSKFKIMKKLIAWVATLAVYGNTSTVQHNLQNISK